MVSQNFSKSVRLWTNATIYPTLMTIQLYSHSCCLSRTIRSNNKLVYLHIHSAAVVLIENVRTAKHLKIVQIAHCHKHLGDNTRFENECFNVPKSLPYHSRLRKWLGVQTSQSQKLTNGWKWPFLTIFTNLRSSVIGMFGLQVIFTVYYDKEGFWEH